MRGVAGRYFVELDPEAQRDLEGLRAFDVRSVVEALRQLRYEAEIEARNRKPLRAPIPAVSEASWELRVGDYRALYRVQKDRTVRVLRVILKGRRTIDEATGSSHGE
jgi:mRNA-degrading endonuclease RelE of RelBE toxin-antitoxin system